MEELPFRRDVERLPIFGLGCAGGVLGLARAAAMARAAPGSLVLFLVVELCGLTFRNSDVSKSNIIATALFGDGAAAALVTCERGAAGPEIAGWGEYTWPGTLEVMGWRVEDDGFGVLFSRDIPAIVRARYGTAVDAFLARQGLTRKDLDGTLCHPGGAKVLDALEGVFGLAPGAMTHARAVLRDYGNMSGATVLFVLARGLQGGLRGRHLVSSLGPGFSAGFLLLEA
jgi:alkylresorcinol/alkylpyrone synthase